MTLDLDGIAVFVAVAEEGGFRAAGKRLGVSGSAVSMRLRQLKSAWESLWPTGPREACG